MKNRSLWLDSIFVTILVFVLIGIVKYNPVNFHVFNLKESWKDFELTDVYFSGIKSKTIRDTAIVIVDLDTLGRGSLAEIIKKINAKGPSVLAIDAYFLNPSSVNEDTALVNAFQSAKEKIVLAGFYEHHAPHDGSEPNKATWIQTHQMFGQYPTGHINLVGNEVENTTVRYFRPVLEDKEALAVQIVRKYDSEKAEQLLKRNKSTEAINYLGGYEQFFHVSGNEILSGTSLHPLKDKIVLLGFAGEVSEKKSLEDAHFTPLNEELAGRSFPDMYGVVVHANIVSMILMGDYINKVPVWLNVLLAGIIGMLHVFAYIYFYVKRHKWFHLFAKISQLVTSILLMFIVLTVMGGMNLKFDPALSLLIILLSVDVLYFYEPLAQFLSRKFHYNTFFSSKH